MNSITRHNVDTDQCVKNVGSRFDLVLVAAVRVRELKRGHKPLLNNKTTNGYTITALSEIEAGLVGREYLKKI
jgi:DNA-directed RNA polymerase subunit omega